MKRRFTNSDILIFADDKNERVNASIEQHDVIDESRKALSQIYELCDYVHDLAFLEGKIVQDDFFAEKEAFNDEGQNYGYLHPEVTQCHGTNYFRYFKKVPLKIPTNKKTNFNKDALPTSGPHGLKGYSLDKLKKASSHQDELDLAINTEDEFKRFRIHSRLVKKFMRKIRPLKIMEKYFKG